MPKSDRPRWEADPAPAELVEVAVFAAAAALCEHYEAGRDAGIDEEAASVGPAVLERLAAPENRPALVAWLIAEGIATPFRQRGTNVTFSDDGRPLYLLDGAP